MRILIVLIVVFSTASIHGQINRKHFLGYTNSIFSNLIVKKNCLYVSGYMFSSTSPKRSGGFLGKLSLQGDSLFERSYVDTPATARTTWWNNNVILAKDGNFLIACNMLNKARIMRVDSVGGILKSRDYFSYFATQNTDLFSYNIFEDVDSSIWVISNSRKNNDLNYLQITRFNKDLDTLAKVVLGNTNFQKWARNFVKIDANRYLIAGSYNNEGLNQVFTNIATGDFFIEIDSAGKKLSEYYLTKNHKLGGMGAMVYEAKDSSYVMFGSECYEIIDTGGDFGYLFYYPMVYKVDKKFQILWKRKMGNGIYSQGNLSLNIQHSTEKDGYVFAGELYDTFKINRLDSYGTFGKVSLDGDSIWLRKYRLFEDTTSYVSGHIYCIQNSEDGGYYLSGSSIGGPKLEDGYQGGWLLKVDQYGCLVPGCNLPSSLPVIEEIDVHYKVFPNPVQADLNIFVDDTKGTDLTIRFCDALGVPLKCLQHRGAATTYILPLQSYASGTYIVQFWQEGRLVKGEKVVLAR